MAEQLIERMTGQVARWEADGDRRAVFLDCYARMTRAVDAALGAGRFADTDWVSVLLDRFAQYYFATLDDDDDVSIPLPWALAHSAAREGAAAPLQLLLAGVNAHINYDLVLALVDVLEPEWREHDAASRARRLGDYELINDVIAETADQVQDLVVERHSPGLDLLDRGLGTLDERLAVRLLSGWRRQVWRHATELLDVPDPAARRERAATIERQCARRARWLLW